MYLRLVSTSPPNKDVDDNRCEGTEALPCRSGGRASTLSIASYTLESSARGPARSRFEEMGPPQAWQWMHGDGDDGAA